MIWNDRQFDYTYLLIILTKKLELMEKRFRFCRITTDWEKTAQDIGKLQLVIKRIKKDNYSYNCKVFMRKDYRRPEYLIRQDVRYFTNIMNKKLRNWWD